MWAPSWLLNYALILWVILNRNKHFPNWKSLHLNWNVYTPTAGTMGKSQFSLGVKIENYLPRRYQHGQMIVKDLSYWFQKTHFYTFPVAWSVFTFFHKLQKCGYRKAKVIWFPTVSGLIWMGIWKFYSRKDNLLLLS